MYKIVKIRDRIRVPADLLGKPLEDAIREVIIKDYEGRFVKNVGFFLAFYKIDEIKEGEILPEDPAVYYDTTFEMIVWNPEINELVEGEVKNVREFGAFIEIGPMDGMVHISQITDDAMSFSKSGVLQGKKTKRTLKVGDFVRARIVAVSTREEEIRIGLTMRQPYLGKPEWYEEK